MSDNSEEALSEDEVEVTSGKKDGTLFKRLQAHMVFVGQLLKFAPVQYQPEMEPGSSSDEEGGAGESQSCRFQSELPQQWTIITCSLEFDSIF